MQDINLPRHVIESADQRWARPLLREAVVWKAKTRKLRSMQNSSDGRSTAIPAELRRSLDQCGDLARSRFSKTQQ